MSRLGKLFGIGAGPGDSSLLTLKAVRILQDVSVVIVPRGDRGEKSQALRIVTPFLHNEQELREITLPMTREPDSLQEVWRKAAIDLIPVLDGGRDTAFVTLGDSTLYSTYFYLYDVLKQSRPDLEVETVPGISSFSAGAALLNRALAIGQESLAIVPATRGPDCIRLALTTFDNVVLLKVVPVMKEVLGLLAELGCLDDAAYVCRCGMPGQFFQDGLAADEELPGDYFSLILVRGMPQHAPPSGKYQKSAAGS